MYQVDEIVMYGMYGLCRVAEISMRSFGDEETEYYVLRPVKDQKTTVFVPTQNEAMTKKMHAPLTAQEIDAIVNDTQLESVWIENLKLRKDVYKKMIQDGDEQQLVCLVRTLTRRQEELFASGRKFHATDDAFLKEARKKLSEEFSYVLKLNEQQVLHVILYGGAVCV